MTKPHTFNSRFRLRRFQAGLWLAVLLVVSGGYLVWRHHNAQAVTVKTISAQPQNSVNYSPPPSADNNPNQTRKGSSSPASTLDGNSIASGVAPFTAQIVSSTVSNNNLHVGTAVNGAANGTCTLTASKSGQSTLQLGSSAVQQDVNNYDCGVFNIPTSQFPANGAWRLLLSVASNGTSASDTATVTISGQ